jgi:hypothetical protein
MRLGRASLVAVSCLTAGLAVAPAAVAADPVTLAGTVVRDGAPVTGVSVSITVAETDMVTAAVTDDGGAFAVTVPLAVGDHVRIVAVGRTNQSGPDAKGCVTSETPTGSLTEVVDALPPGTVTVPMDDEITSTVCRATATPRSTSHPRITPPATDRPGAGRPAGTSGSLLLVVGGLTAVIGGAVSLARRRA